MNEFFPSLAESEESACSTHIVQEVHVSFPVSVRWQVTRLPLREVEEDGIRAKGNT